MTKNVIYAGEVIYDAGSNLAYPGPRGAQRHREIRGPARKIAAQRLDISS
jgi:hypothetical protein